MQIHGLIANPPDQRAQDICLDRATGFTLYDRRFCPSPLLRTAPVQAAHKQTVGGAHEINMAGPAFSAERLTVSQSQFLLAVPMESLGACPTIAVDFEHANRFPGDVIGSQGLAGGTVCPVFPKNDDTNWMLYPADEHLPGEIPVLLLADVDTSLGFCGDLPSYFGKFSFVAAKHYLAVQFDVGHIVSVVPLDMIEYFRAGKIAVEGKVSGSLSGKDLIDQLDAQLGMGFELPGPRAVPFLDALACMTDRGIVQGDDASWMVAGCLVFLRQFQSPVVQSLGIPINLGQPSVEAGLSGSIEKLLAHPVHSIFVGDHEFCQVLREMPSLWFIFGDISKLIQGFLDYVVRYSMIVGMWATSRYTTISLIPIITLLKRSKNHAAPRFK